jgi:hypothetical protein
MRSVSAKKTSSDSISVAASHHHSRNVARVSNAAYMDCGSAEEVFATTISDRVLCEEDESLQMHARNAWEEKTPICATPSELITSAIASQGLFAASYGDSGDLSRTKKLGGQEPSSGSWGAGVMNIKGVEGGFTYWGKHRLNGSVGGGAVRWSPVELSSRMESISLFKKVKCLPPPLPGRLLGMNEPSVIPLLQQSIGPRSNTAMNAVQEVSLVSEGEFKVADAPAASGAANSLCTSSARGDDEEQLSEEKLLLDKVKKLRDMIRDYSYQYHTLNSPVIRYDQESCFAHDVTFNISTCSSSHSEAMPGNFDYDISFVMDDVVMQRTMRWCRSSRTWNPSSLLEKPIHLLQPKCVSSLLSTICFIFISSSALLTLLCSSSHLDYIAG